MSICSLFGTSTGQGKLLMLHTSQVVSVCTQEQVTLTQGHINNKKEKGAAILSQVVQG